jgi:phosphoglycolate phosphatase-like HAD superfamily hydrolase
MATPQIPARYQINETRKDIKHTNEPRVGGLRLVVFDFDQTLTVFHVFKHLAGWGNTSVHVNGEDVVIPPPFATGEEGQVRRIEALDRCDAFQKSGGFASLAFGGAARVAEVRQSLEMLRDHGVKLAVCTKGLVGTVRKCLSDLDILSLFAEVYGNVGFNYGKTPYDNEVATMPANPEIQQLLGSQAQSNWSSKSQLITVLKKRDGLRKEQVALVEDDPEEIMRASKVCQTVFVREAAGMTADHFEQLRVMNSRKPDSASGDGSSGSWCVVQ